MILPHIDISLPRYPPQRIFNPLPWLIQRIQLHVELKLLLFLSMEYR